MSTGRVVHDYDPTWPDRFDGLRRLLAETLGDAVVAIEHVGSTAVPGLPAKPIIDVDIALADYSGAHELRQTLEAAGFRRALAGDFADRQFYVREEAGRPTCHLSLTYLGSETWLSNRAFRDCLLSDPGARREYGDLKKRLALEHDDAAAYTEAKTAIVHRLAGPGRRGSPARPPLIQRRFLVLGGVLLLALVAGSGGIAYYSETSRGSDGLPDHRPIRAADLFARPEAKLFYPGSTVLRSARSDQSADPNNPTSAPARIETLLTTGGSAGAVQAWYAEKLAAAGWRTSRSSLTSEVPAGEVDSEWRRGQREFLDLNLNLDPAMLGGVGAFGAGGLLYRVDYLVGTGSP